MAQDSWHLSKSVPATFVLAIAVQTVGLVWYMSTLDATVEHNVREIARHETRLIAIENVVQTQAVTMARMDENIKAIRVAIEKISMR